MSKDTFYFSHDYNARNDIKIKKLIAKHKFAGYGIYWAIVEELYNNANALPLDYECIAFDFNIEIDLLKSIINDFDLFVIDNGFFGSLSVQRRLEQRNEKSLKARESANKRWNNIKNDANALQMQSEGNAIKESKVKESKEIKTISIDDRKLKFATTLKPFIDFYGKDFLNDFYKYWTEPNKSGTKFKQELEKTWSLERRLETWAKNDKNFNNNNNSKNLKNEQVRQLASIARNANPNL